MPLIYIWNIFLQKLQTFHHARPHRGSPLKAESFKDIMRKKRNPIYDPRPVKYRKLEGREDTFRNLCVNFQVSSLKYLFIEVYPILI